MDVFEHLQREISRLQSAEARDGIPSLESNQTSHCDAFLDVWRMRAQRHYAQRQEYWGSYVRKYGSCEASASHGSRSSMPPSFCKKNPQPGEARRWFRQAESDLRAAVKDLDAYRPSYEWACFKCHQVSSLIVLPVHYHKWRLVEIVTCFLNESYFILRFPEYEWPGSQLMILFQPVCMI